MATYLPSSSAVPQSVDGLQTLYLMKPNYGLTESSNNASSNNMLFISPNGVLAQANNTFSGQAVVQNHQQAAYYNNPNSSLFPSTGTLLSNNQTNLSSSSRNYQSWAGGGNEVSFMQQSLNDENAFMVNINPHPSYSSIRTQPGLASIEHIHQMESNSLQRGGEREGLSLSLSPGQNQLAPQLVSQPTANSLSFLQDVDGKSNREALAGMGSFLTTSKYLKATQQLLEEVVSVNNKGAKPPKSTGSSIKQNKPGFSSFNNNNNNNNNMSCVKDPLTFSVDTSERQELQMKKAKLMAMLDEVDRRYRQYYFQMQMVVSSLDSAAGIGSAKTYTSLALKTISRHFRCLRDAICGQIRVACDSLGETEDVLEATGKSEPSRMHQYLNPPPPRPSLQHLGILQQQQQQHVWRPQRGLPERSVSILRAWLFEHFLHPYPKDGDKIMLARQTGLSRSQVSNWFINARVRLWKPMVEEMYTEEMKDVGHANNNNNNHNHNHNHDGTGGKLPQPTGNGQKDQTNVKEEGKTGNIPAPNSNQINNNLGKRLLSGVKNGGDDYDGQCDNDGNDDGGNEDGDDDDGDDDDEDVVDDDGVHEEEQQDYHAGMKRSRSNNGMGMVMGMGMGMGVGMGMGMDDDGNYISNGGASYVDAYPSYHHHHHQAGHFNPVTLTLGLHQNNNHYNSNNSNSNINNININNNNNEMNIGLSLAGAPVQQEQQQSPFHRLLHGGGAPAEDFFHVAHNADSARHVIPNFDALDFHGRRIVSTHHDFVA